MNFPIHTIESAPDAARKLLSGVSGAFGFVPNMIGGMANAPALVEGYTTLAGIFDKTSFSAAERQVILLTTSRFNECHYCMAAHSTISGMQGVDEDIVAALREDLPIADKRLEALRIFTRQLVEKRGWVDEQDVASFLAAGFSASQMLEAVLGVGVKTLSNYANHLLETPLDAAFEANSWSPPAA